MLSRSKEATKHLGMMLASRLKGGEVLCLRGELGAGKTTFVGGLINFFDKKARVLSPTFIIVRHYSVKHKSIKNIYHIDLYRLDDTKSIEDLGILELFNKSDTVTAIEWPEKMEDLLPRDKIDLNFTVLSANKREIRVMLPCIETR